MRITCVGGGPAGLYFAISAKLRDAGHDITVIERDPPGATYGWGVGYWDNLLDTLYRNDPESARKIRAASRLWQQHQVRLGDETAYLDGYGYSLGRASLLEILAQRATDLGVHVRYGHAIGDLSELEDAQLIVAADGAASRVRQLHVDDFGTQVASAGNPYIWLGTDKAFASFVFAFEQTRAGWIWLYAYPSSPAISTCVVECTPDTWRGLGFDSAAAEDSIAMLEKIFSSALDGHALISRSRGEPARWLQFPQVTNEMWYSGNVVLVGDAAHTTHFTLGSGTSLAMLDAFELADSLYDHELLPVALADYNRQRRGELRAVQAEARSSMAWFEQLDCYTDRDAVAFAFAMAGRGAPQPPWSYLGHLAIQNPALRRAKRTIDSGRRWYGARRRGEPLTSARYRP